MPGCVSSLVSVLPPKNPYSGIFYAAQIYVKDKIFVNIEFQDIATTNVALSQKHFQEPCQTCKIELFSSTIYVFDRF